MELYTSEGCSSCPPADQWLSTLKKAPGLWDRFVPAGFHVTYWDDLGWKDPMASKVFTHRQKVYAKQWGTSNVYTPAVVLNGKEWRGWSRGAGIPQDKNRNPGILEIEALSDREFKVIFRPENSTANAYQASFALMGFDIVSNVVRGENRGKLLKHDFVVLDLQNVTLQKQGGAWQAQAVMKSNDAVAADRRGIAVWINNAEDASFVQAAGGYV